MSDTANDSFDLQMNVPDSIEWFLHHMAWAHLDEIPPKVLHQLLVSVELRMKCALILMAGIRCGKMDDVQAVIAYHNSYDVKANEKTAQEQFAAFHFWVTAEATRRLNRVSITSDVLVSDMLTKNEGLVQPVAKRTTREKR